MKIEVQHHCSDFNSYRAARVKSLFNAEKGCDWEKTITTNRGPGMANRIDRRTIR